MTTNTERETLFAIRRCFADSAGRKATELKIRQARRIINDRLEALSQQSGEALATIGHDVELGTPYVDWHVGKTIPDGAKLYTQPQSDLTAQLQAQVDELLAENKSLHISLAKSTVDNRLLQAVIAQKDKALEFYANSTRHASPVTAREALALTPTDVKPLVQDGWQLVPIEPTDEMMEQGSLQGKNNEKEFRLRTLGASLVYKAMLSASPITNKESK